ncbi:MAG: hypothetical protein D6740_03645 [Alphaproteobacteria bacterium]|nr:MAG: hypothetical protein D6740_03645 [Alphaproteobacteria bacterium]
MRQPGQRGGQAHAGGPVCQGAFSGLRGQAESRHAVFGTWGYRLAAGLCGAAARVTGRQEDDSLRTGLGRGQILPCGHQQNLLQERLEGEAGQGIARGDAFPAIAR